MDLQKLVDSIDAICCLMSVEKKENGEAGEIRIVTGNAAYIASTERPIGQSEEMFNKKFTKNQLYTEYLERDLNFEIVLYESAINKKCLHSYVKPERFPVWMNLTFLPVDYEADENGKHLCYCLYVMELDEKPDSKRMSNISGDIASAVLETCIKLSSSRDIRDTASEVIEDIRNLCKADNCCIMTIDNTEKKCELFCESTKEGSGLRSLTYYLKNFDFYDIAATWEATIAGSNCVIAKNEAEMQVIKERNPIWYESLMGANVKTITLFPLKSHEELLGYIWAINFKAEDAIMIKETLELTTFILGAELGTHLLMDRLKILSSKDMLTGVMNRNEMNNFVDSLALSGREDKSVGVIFCDLNGLKTVNDEQGHIAGDTLLKNAAAVLLEVFSSNEIFRAGGDEFSIIVTGVCQCDINRYIEKIRESSEKHAGVSFALGGYVVENSRDIRIALRKADEAMYVDKNLYYERTGKKHRC